LQVTLSNNSKYPAQLRGAEPDKDLAIIKIDAPAAELAPIEVGVSSKLVVGQKVRGAACRQAAWQPAACLQAASMAQAAGNCAFSSLHGAVACWHVFKMCIQQATHTDML
jgi:hypothetical protein